MKMKKLIISSVLSFAGIIAFAQEKKLQKTEKSAKTEIVQSEPKTQENTIVVEGEGKEEAVSLNGETLIVKGNNNIVHAAGDAAKIVVEGNGSQVVVDSTKEIEIEGTKSYVYYRKGEPTTKVSNGSAVQKLDE